MAGIAVSAAAAQARALDSLLFAFRSADATAASRALSLRQIGIEPSAALAQLERAGVIKPGADDPAARYLDERALRAYQTSQRSRTAIFLAIAAGIMAFALGAIFLLVSRR